MRRRPVFEGVEHPAKARFHLFCGIAGDRECFIHDVGAMIADRPGRQLDPIADDIVLKSGDIERILLLERGEPALRHRKWVVAELDLAGLFVTLVRREIDNPTKFKAIVPAEAELPTDLQPRGAGKRREILRSTANKKDRVSVSKTKLRSDRFGPLGSNIPGNWPGALVISEEDVGEPGLAL